MNLSVIILASLVNSSLFSFIEEYKEEDFHLHWEKGNNWMQFGSNYTISCYLQHTGRGNFRPHDNKVYIIPPHQNLSAFPRHVAPKTRHPRLNRHLLTASLEVGTFMAKDEGMYECVWTRKNNVTVIKKYIHNMTEAGKIEVLERSPYHLRLNEGEPFSLFVRDTIYPKEEEGYKVQWSRVYKLATQNQYLSELIFNEDKWKTSTVTNEKGYYTEKLDVDGDAVNTDMSGTYVLTITFRDTIEVVEWDVEIENEEADVKLVVNGPGFTVLNSTFYPPGKVLSIDCFSLSIPKTDVFIESQNDEDSDFKVVDRSQLTELLGTYENGYRWNTTFSRDTKIKCSCTKNEKKATKWEHILLADEKFDIVYKHKINDNIAHVEGTEQVYEGDDVYLRCIVPNVHGWNASWFFEKQRIASKVEIKGYSKHISLNLRNVNLANNGTYKCVLENEITEDSLNKTVTIHKTIKPFAYAEIKTEIVVEHYKNFSLDCGLTGTPTPLYQWTRNGHLLSVENKKILNVFRASAEDNGSFECQAKNRAGSAKTKFNVEVKNIPNEKGLWMKITMFGTVVVFGVVFSIIVLIRLIISRKSKIKEIRFFPVFEQFTRQTTVQSDQTEMEQLYRISTPTINSTIAPQYLEKGHELGSGQFGIVSKGWLTPSRSNTLERLPVAIKEIGNDSHTNESDLILLLIDELNVMIGVGKHPNVLALIGSSVENNRPSIVLEYIECGCLKTYLQNYQNMLFGNSSEYSVNSSEYLESAAVKPIHEGDLVSFGMQIAYGMLYLASKQCVHRDLALRNILVTKQRIIRIADFGLAKINSDKDYYRPVKNITPLLPQRWTAPECFLEQPEGKFTEKSDVWSFAICLYEIFTLGGTPYPNIASTDLLGHVFDGGINNKPEHCPDEIYELMKYCWAKDPNQRPNFETCFEFMKRCLNDISREMFEKVGRLLIEEAEKQERMSNWI